MNTVIVLASLATAGYVASYALMCWQRATGVCLHCDGTGHRHRRPHGADCTWCDGTGRRVRVGRRAIEYLRMAYDANPDRTDRTGQPTHHRPEETR